MDRKKSVIDDMILQNLRIYKEDIQLTVRHMCIDSTNTHIY